MSAEEHFNMPADIRNFFGGKGSQVVSSQEKPAQNTEVSEVFKDSFGYSH